MTTSRVLLIGWDAADWKVVRPLMDAGKMPNVQQLVKSGVSGEIATLHPPLSPMLWTSIATGKRPFKHGIHGFAEPAPDGSGVRPVTNLSRTSKALWNILNQNDRRSTVIGWWPSHPAEPINGVMVSDQYHRAGGPLAAGWPLPPYTVHPPGLAGTLAGLRLHPDLIVPEMVEPFIPLAREIDQEKDHRLAALLRTLAECASIHSAATWLLDNQPWDFFAVYYEAIDHFCHSFMRYHPPRRPWIGERDFEIYHNVVSAAYQLHDQMLGDLLKKAGDGVTVILVSDHGFHPDHLRPCSIPDIPAGPAIEHRDFGVFAIRGPAIRSDGVLHGASLLDVAPTILTLYGLPVGEDMDGKVLSQAFLKVPELAFIPSWEEVPGSDGRHPPHTRLDSLAAHAALEQMVALGYIERPDEDRDVAMRKTLNELRYNLGEAYQDAGMHVEAHRIFTELSEADPDEQRFSVRLFVSCQALGLHGQMRDVVDDLERRESALKQPAVVDYLKAQIWIAEKRYVEALAALEQVAEENLVRPGLLLQTADLYLRLHRPRNARHVYEKALAIDPDNVQAHVGLCRMALRRRRFDTAAHSALDALQRTHHDPLAHFLLGCALTGMKDNERAAEAFRAAISFNPNFPQAHARLADLLENRLGDVESAREHRRLAREMRRRRSLPLTRLVSDAAVPLTAGDSRAAAWSPARVISTKMPPPGESLIVVTGLPRSGTSLVMQMLAAANVNVLSDGVRAADEDNPRGYFEFDRVKNLLKDSQWLLNARGRAIKIVAPLLAALPPGLACRVILCDRDLDQVLDSQDRMIQRRNALPPSSPDRRRLLKEEYERTLSRVTAMLSRRPHTRFVVVNYESAVSDPLAAAERINDFLGGGLDVEKMTAAVEPALHRNRGFAPSRLH